MARSMSSDEEIARLWKINRTIHELVKDRVSSLSSFSNCDLIHRTNGQGFQVSEDEIAMDLATFRNNYSSSIGSVE